MSNGLNDHLLGDTLGIQLSISLTRPNGKMYPDREEVLMEKAAYQTAAPERVYLHLLHEEKRYRRKSFTPVSNIKDDQQLLTCQDSSVS